jgi:hypothetical protein
MFASGTTSKHNLILVLHDLSYTDISFHFAVSQEQDNVGYLSSSQVLLEVNFFSYIGVLFLKLTLQKSTLP